MVQHTSQQRSSRLYDESVGQYVKDPESMTFTGNDKNNSTSTNDHDPENEEKPKEATMIRRESYQIQVVGTVLLVMVAIVGLFVILFLTSPKHTAKNNMSAQTGSNAPPTETPLNITQDTPFDNPIDSTMTTPTSAPTETPTTADYLMPSPPFVDNEAEKTNYELTYLNGFQEREPTWDDWLFLKRHWSDRIDNSTCPDKGSEDLISHWDYNYDDFVNDPNIPDEDLLNQECTLFPRARNPSALGSRLVRHMFHDSTGGFDGFINVHNYDHNGGLFASQKVLLDDYNSVLLPNKDGVLDIPVRNVLSMADFTAWAGYAAIVRAAELGNDGIQQNNHNGTNIMATLNFNISWGRLSYMNTTANDTGPIEYIPTSGNHGSGDQVAAYFLDQFGFDKRQTTTLMAVHTYGTAALSASGFSGSWTQAKNRFTNQFQQQLRFPLPFTCDDGDNCTYFSKAVDDFLDYDNAQECLPEFQGRCEGWEQIAVQGLDDTLKPKFQWSHSCNPDGTGCTHLMLNTDMGLFRDLHGYICTAFDEMQGVEATLGRTCIEGMIKSYPEESVCDKETSRVLASCFLEHEEMSSYIIEDSEDSVSWMKAFAPLFDIVTRHRLVPGSEMHILTERKN